MSRKTSTYGDLPAYEEFAEAFEEEVDGPYYRIRSGLTPLPLHADGNYTASQLYDLVKKLARSRNEEANDLASAIMETLGFEWV